LGSTWEALGGGVVQADPLTDREGGLPYGLTASSFSELPILWEEQLHLAS
jgi:hypothetical protein